MSPISKLPALVREKFENARAKGDLTFYETQVSLLQCNGLPVCIAKLWVEPILIESAIVSSALLSSLSK